MHWSGQDVGKSGRNEELHCFVEGVFCYYCYMSKLLTKPTCNLHEAKTCKYCWLSSARLTHTIYQHKYCIDYILHDF